MMRYLLTAAALKAFSISPETKRLYRGLGNRIGASRRSQRGLPGFYLERARYLLRAIETYQIPCDGAQVLELGTGWIHWESLVVRLFYDAQLTMFDVWDNRQLDTLKAYTGHLASCLESLVEVAPNRRVHASQLLRAIGAVSSFDELYALLGLRYVVDPSGTLSRFPDQIFSLVMSGNVLQHVHLDGLPGYTRDISRILKPGGYSVHTIDMSDQLSYYDPQVSVKNYLRYSDRIWRLLFQADIQYFNRLQRPQWLDLFEAAELLLLEEKRSQVNIDELAVNRRYASFSRQDLECTVMRVTHHKPGGVA